MTSNTLLTKQTTTQSSGWFYGKSKISIKPIIQPSVTSVGYNNKKTEISIASVSTKSLLTKQTTTQSSGWFYGKSKISIKPIIQPSVTSVGYNNKKTEISIASVSTKSLLTKQTTTQLSGWFYGNLKTSIKPIIPPSVTSVGYNNKKTEISIASVSTKSLLTKQTTTQSSGWFYGNGKTSIKPIIPPSVTSVGYNNKKTEISIASVSTKSLLTKQTTTQSSGWFYGNGKTSIKPIIPPSVTSVGYNNKKTEISIGSVSTKSLLTKQTTIQSGGWFYDNTKTSIKPIIQPSVTSVGYNNKKTEISIGSVSTKSLLTKQTTTQSSGWFYGNGKTSIKPIIPPSVTSVGYNNKKTEISIGSVSTKSLLTKQTTTQSSGWFYGNGKTSIKPIIPPSVTSNIIPSTSILNKNSTNIANTILDTNHKNKTYITTKVNTNNHTSMNSIYNSTNQNITTKYTTTTPYMPSNPSKTKQSVGYNNKKTEISIASVSTKSLLTKQTTTQSGGWFYGNGKTSIKPIIPPSVTSVGYNNKKTEISIASVSTKSLLTKQTTTQSSGWFYGNGKTSIKPIIPPSVTSVGYNNKKTEISIGSVSTKSLLTKQTTIQSGGWFYDNTKTSIKPIIQPSVTSVGYNNKKTEISIASVSTKSLLTKQTTTQSGGWFYGNGKTSIKPIIPPSVTSVGYNNKKTEISIASVSTKSLLTKQTTTQSSGWFYGNGKTSIKPIIPPSVTSVGYNNKKTEISIGSVSTKSLLTKQTTIQSGGWFYDNTKTSIKPIIQPSVTSVGYNNKKTEISIGSVSTKSLLTKQTTTQSSGWFYGNGKTSIKPIIPPSVTSVGYNNKKTEISIGSVSTKSLLTKQTTTQSSGWFYGNGKTSIKPIIPPSVTSNIIPSTSILNKLHTSIANTKSDVNYKYSNTIEHKITNNKPTSIQSKYNSKIHSLTHYTVYQDGKYTTKTYPRHYKG